MRSLRAKFAIAAAVIGLIAVLSSALTIRATSVMSEQVQIAVTAEKRMQRLSDLATQVGSLIVILFEAAQTGVDAQTRQARLDGLSAGIRQIFAAVRADLGQDVSGANSADLNEQSRRATRSIGIARMEALFERTIAQFVDPKMASPAQLQGAINAFSIGFDPLLNAAMTENRRARDAAIARVDALKGRLSRLALGVAILAVLLVAGFYFLLVQPQMSRLDRLQIASRSIGNEDFRIALPTDQDDEIGQLFQATNAMAASLGARKKVVESEWSRLNQTIADRTEALRKANDALSKTDEDRRRFFADVSHELRTPLTVILTEAELAMKSGEPVDGPFGVIHGRARRLSQRIDDLLRIARSEGGTLGLEQSTFDLSAVCRSAADEVMSIARNAGVTLAVDEGDPISVRGDQNWTRQVITGLIENALRHARDGRVVEVRILAIDDQALVRIIDNGAGIPVGELTRVTRRFAQSDKGKSGAAGFGIGLSLAHWVVTEQGGQLRIDSPVPEHLKCGDQPGTIVTVSLPIAEE
ncbi:sensor histidine kinase [Loktanella sp. S4079]|uniref:sensor histidine kinase n=1 Tax=Loktanella sp. S4079 TaxID=579483 RepID=UPI0005F9E0F1|nr:HAMP domain-containing sensor histidine kinase [Loktanella sp. S4079]KJZ18219.1 hypothetical protein TW80_14870 [Loktanella sp. S4079]